MRLADAVASGLVAIAVWAFADWLVPPACGGGLQSLHFYFAIGCSAGAGCWSGQRWRQKT
jgi:hypothetical protein